jgi:hypothetical protein
MHNNHPLYVSGSVVHVEVGSMYPELLQVPARRGRGARTEVMAIRQGESNGGNVSILWNLRELKRWQRLRFSPAVHYESLKL